jgi:hypothetical protein
MQVGTYNVNGRKPPVGLNLAPWLAAAPEADVVIVGFQEIVPLNASNVMNGALALQWLIPGETAQPAADMQHAVVCALSALLQLRDGHTLILQHVLRLLSLHGNLLDAAQQTNPRMTLAVTVT